MEQNELKLRITLYDGEYGEAVVQYWADNNWIDKATFKCLDWAKEYVKLMGQDKVDVVTYKEIEI